MVAKLIEITQQDKDGDRRALHIAVGLFLLVTFLMVMFSTNAIQRWKSPWNYIFLLSVCTALIMVCFALKPSLTVDSKFIKWLIICLALSLLGGLNIFYSESRVISAKIIIIFMFSGPLIWWVSTILLRLRTAKISFYKFLTLLLILCCIYGCIELFIYHRIYLFSNNSIPAGSIILLSLIGPFGLYYESSKIGRIISILCIIAGIMLIVLIGKRGAVLGLMGMLLAGAVLLHNRLSIAILAGTVLLTLIGFMYHDHLPGELNRHLITSNTSKQRVENLFFAWHLFQKKPLVGYGIGAPISTHLKGYKEILSEKNYTQYIRELRGFDNIVLTGFVMAGSVFSLIYLCLTGFSIYRYVYVDHVRQKTKLILILPLFAFLIQSMTYDSLLFPHVNWLFHAILGALDDD